MPIYRSLDSLPGPENRFSNLSLILGDQLNANHSWFREKKDERLFLIAELKQETEYASHHIQKITAFFTAMENFAGALGQSGHHVLYLNLDETAAYPTLPDLLEEIIDCANADSFYYQQPDEYRLAQQLESFGSQGLLTEKFDTEHFFLPFAELGREFRKGTAMKMEFFYRRMRKRFGILMDGEMPMGGRWNYDASNRKKLTRADLPGIPEPLLFTNSCTDTVSRIKRHNVRTIGTIGTHLIWPASRKQAREVLEHFCKFCLPNFGRFQDVMTDNSPHAWSLYHSRLSFALNSKMLHPGGVLHTVLQYWKEYNEANQEQIDLAQVEGFVRQILGWREFVRGMYWANMPDYAKMNALQAQADLPAWYWTGNTRMNCMKQCIDQSLQHAYAHHIQRLMVTGNFALLAGLDPDQVDEWYLGIYIDAVEWVEMPNTRGMSQFADGGLIGTKPYISSGSYIQKMSDYCKSCHYDVKLKTEGEACPFNSLYWHFVNRHAGIFSQNPRMSMVYRSWEKMPPVKQKAILDKGKKLLQNLDSL
jgi:deoxyribodipyrimidine photolyase-related protein